MARDPLWLEHIKRTSETYSSFLEWLAEEREKVRDQYKLAAGDKVVDLQAQEKVLDNLLALCRMSDRENRQQEEYKRAISQH